MHIFWETSDWSGGQVESTINCMSWVPSADAHEDGWLGCGTGSSVGITRTRILSKSESSSAAANAKRPQNERINFNLRGHQRKVTLAVWNSDPIKLATCDEGGVIYVWVPYEDRWSVELVNDRGFKVRDFCWSPNGNSALICYEDNFVLIGSASGQRIWSQAYPASPTINCGTWSPDSRQVFLGTGDGSMHVLSDQGIAIMERTIVQGEPIKQLLCSYDRRPRPTANNNNNNSGNNNDTNNNNTEPNPEMLYLAEDPQPTIIAAAFKNGAVAFLRSHDDPDPVIRQTDLKLHSMCWSVTGEYLAVVGSVKCSATLYRYQLHIFDTHGTQLLRTMVPMHYKQFSSLACFTWAHDNECLVFAGSGSLAGDIYVARLCASIPPLHMLSSYSIWSSLQQAGGTNADRIGQLPIPARTKNLVLAHNYHVIQCRIPSDEELEQAVCKATEWRWYCTVKPAGAGRSGCFVLHMEHLGSMVPVLAGRQTNRLLPEFEIRLCRKHKTETTELVDNTLDVPDVADSRSVTPEAEAAALTDDDLPCSSRTTGSGGEREVTESPLSLKLRGPRARTNQREAAAAVDAPGSSQQQRDNNNATADRGNGLQPRLAFQRSSMWRRSKRQLQALMQRAQQHSQTTPTKVTRTYGYKQEQRLVHVTSNVWCTRFKIIGMANHLLPPYLGQVVYKTSVLHLQPRQMTVHVVDLKSKRALLAPVAPPIDNDDTEDLGVDEGLLGQQLDEGPKIAPLENELFFRNAPESAVVSEEQQLLTQVLGEFNELRAAVDRHISRMREFASELQQSSQQLPNNNATAGSSSAASSSSAPVTRPLNSWNAPAGGPQQQPHSRSNSTAAGAARPAAGVVPVANKPQQPLNAARRRSSPTTETEKEANSNGAVAFGSEWRRQLDALEFIDEDESLVVNMALPVPDEQAMRARTLSIDAAQHGYRPAACLPLPGSEDGAASSRSDGWQQQQQLRASHNQLSAVLARACAQVNRANQQMPTAAAAPNSTTNASKQLTEISGVLDKLYKLANELTSRAADEPGCSSTSSHHVAKVAPNKDGRQALHAEYQDPADFDAGDDSAHNFYELRSRIRDIAGRVSQLERRLNYGNELLDEVRGDLQQRVQHIRCTLEEQQAQGGSTGSGSRGSLTRPSAAASRAAANANLTSSTPPAGSISRAGACSKRGATVPRDSHPPPIMGRWQLARSSARSANDENVKGGKKSGQPKDKEAGRPEGQDDESVLILNNKTPFWNEQSQVYQLDFGGRVTQESAKNFQIEHTDIQVMQFGRIENGCYTLDFQSPFSAAQAFAVALASITQRLK